MNSVAAILFALLPLAVLAARDDTKVVYYVYYSDDQCETQTAGVVGKVAGEDFLGVGGRSLDGKCSEEVVCLLDADSSLCQSLNRTNSGNGHLDVDEYGVVVECKLEIARLLVMPSVSLRLTTQVIHPIQTSLSVRQFRTSVSRHRSTQIATSD